MKITNITKIIVESTSKNIKDLFKVWVQIIILMIFCRIFYIKEVSLIEGKRVKTRMFDENVS